MLIPYRVLRSSARCDKKVEGLEMELGLDALFVNLMMYLLNCASLLAVIANSRTTKSLFIR